MDAGAAPATAASGADGAPAEGELSVPNERKRNIAVIAHVDHGKTSLLDCLLRQSATAVLAGDGERVMDSNALEKERGITILAKSTGISYVDPDAADPEAANYHINVVDTPGHSDFGGEVERVLKMVDGVALVVDASEGPMTQTKFVLGKALAAGLRPFVVINKVDRESSRIGEVENDIFELFADLGATDEQLDFSIVYASAKDGWAVFDPEDERKNMAPVFRTIIDTVPAPYVEEGAPFRMIVTQIEADRYLGKCLIGRVLSGSVAVGDSLHALGAAGGEIEQARIMKVVARVGLEKIAVPSATAGDIVSLAGFSTATVNDTLCATTVTEPLEATPIDPPTLAMTFSANGSPLSGRDGTYVTATQILDRLKREIETNVSLRLSVTGEMFEVQGRGEMQLGVLLENMRREGYEVSVSPPKVVFRDQEGKPYVHMSTDSIPRDVRNKLEEPVEEVQIEVPEEFAGLMIEKMASRKAEMQDYTTANGNAHLVFHVPTRGLVGFRAEFINETRGMGVMNTLFHGYTQHQGEISRAQKGALISTAAGKCTSYALDTAESRGTLFVAPGAEVYAGMVIGESSRETDVEINPVKAKATTNIRTMLKDEAVRLAPPRLMTLEDCISYVRPDEMIEVTPNSVRLRKAELDPAVRRRTTRNNKKGN